MFTSVPNAYSNPNENSKVEQRTYNIRTAYLFNLLRFLSWQQDSPHSTSNHINLCTSATSAEYKTLKKLETRQINGKDIKVIRLTPKATKNAPKNCHIAYLSYSKAPSKSHAKAINRQINRHHGNKAVTVGNGEHFIKNGGIVAIVLNNNRMRLNINYKKAKSIGVRMSANLLEVADIVH